MDQPRVPAGSPQGGEFASKSSGGAMPSKGELDEAAQRYSRHAIPGKVIAFASEAVISGNQPDLDMYSREDLRIAQVLVDAVRASEEKPAGSPTGPTTIEGNDTWVDGLFRGMSNDHVDTPKVFSLKVGETLALGRITSFAARQDTAHHYASRDKLTRPAAMLVLKGNAKTFYMDEHSKMGGHGEYITHGKFRITKIEDHKPEDEVGVNPFSKSWGPQPGFYRTITIEQEAVF